MPSFSPCAPQGRFPAAFSWPPYREQVSGRCVEFVIAGEESLRRPASARLRWPFLMGPRGPAMDAEGLGGRNSLPTTDPRLRATDPLESKWPSPAPRTAIPCSEDSDPLRARRDSPARAGRSPAPADRSPAPRAEIARGSMPPEQGIDRPEHPGRERERILGCPERILGSTERISGLDPQGMGREEPSPARPEPLSGAEQRTSAPAERGSIGSGKTGRASAIRVRTMTVSDLACARPAPRISFARDVPRGQHRVAKGRRPDLRPSVRSFDAS